jgi:signal transduction histidine kinase
VLWPSSYRYLTRLNVPATEAESSRVETVLGALRVLLAVLALISFSQETPEPAQFARLVYVLLAIYVAQSLAIFAWVANRPVSPNFLRGLHSADILWPTVITAFSHGASSPFIPIYSFALLAAGFRWGFVEAIRTAVAGCMVLLIEVLFLEGTAWGTFESTRLPVRCAYLLALGYLIGTLGENEKERRAESAVVTRLLRSARTEHSLNAVLQAIFNEFINLFGASDIFLISHDLAADRVYLWQMGVGPQRDARAYSKEISTDDRFAYLLPDHSAAFFCEQISPTSVKMLALGPKAQPRVTPGQVPTLPFLPGNPRSLLAVAAPLGHEWRLRMLLMDARVGKMAVEELSFARSLFEHAATAVYGVYLVRRLRARASAIERARVARELHDGAIQSLISAEMRTDMLRRRAEKEYPAIVRDVESLENLLRGQVIELRELMLQLKPVEVEPDQLLDHLAEQVDRFRRDSGIAARFVSAVEEIHLSAYTCREILLIVQEALVNIRKHAKAEDVLVTFGRHDGYWRLSVSDDGVGFGFEGTLTGAELMRSAKGPAIIKERVTNLGGELFINSKSSRGTQLLIKLPQKGYFSHGK